MKILHTADWHVGNYPGPEKNGINLRGNDIINCLRFILAFALKKLPDLIVISGDIFNQAKVWSDRAMPEMVAVIGFIREFSRIAPVCILKGTPNHDGEGQFQLLEDIFKDDPMVYVFCKPDVVKIDTKTGSVSVAALPGFDRGVYAAKFPGLSKEEENIVFTKELNSIIMALRAECEENIPSVLLAHYTVPGANMESGQTAVFAKSDPVLSPEALDAAGFTLVALGHIHRPQRIQSTFCDCYYSGAVDTLNFNDEGQPRGFYIHDLSGNTHRFIETPYRHFYTIRMGSVDIEAWNAGYTDVVADRLWRDKITDCIVRMIYSCSEDDNKALNRALLEKNLYLDRAFYVSEIVREDEVTVANKSTLPETGQPEENLRKYLSEKGLTDAKIEVCMIAALPIIAAVMAQKKKSNSNGIFIPVSIEVNNYRNYIHEFFDFSDFIFWSVNGENGAGKSSLFMDAIIDCLFEEPRENVITGWIRDAEGVTSGSITFVFRIGDQEFRVVRNRTKKSGRVTLNLAEFVDGEWVSRSKDRVTDTQTEIERLIGMDSDTLKSCGIIMQDGYGLFLESDAETRMNILCNILGINVYSDMEQMAGSKVSELGKSKNQHMDEVNTLISTVEDEDDIHADMEEKEKTIGERQATIAQTNILTNKIRIALNAAIEAADMAEKLSNRLTVAKKKKEAAMADLDSQQQIINEANAFLARETEICTGIELLNELLGREKKLIADKSAYESKQNELTQIMRQIAGDEKAEKRLISEKSNLQMKLQNLESVLAKEPELKAQFDLYCSEKLKLESMESASVSHIQISSQISQLETAKAAMDTRTREEFAVRKTKIEGLQERADLLNRVQCIDVNRANCRFLRDAVEARGNIEPLRTESNQWWQTQKAEIQKMQSQVDDLLKQRDSIHYNTDRYKEQRSLVSRLEADAKRFESLSSVREQLTLIQNRIRDIETELDEIRKRAAELNTKETQIQEILKPLVEAATQYGEIKNSIDKASQWVELDKQLPVMEERRQAAKQNLVFLKNNMDDFDSEIKFLQSDYQKAAQNAAGKDGLAKGVYDYENSIKGMRSTIQEITLQLGALHSLLETQAKTKVRISEHQRVILELADEIGVFETLKKAFSQDGISHSIVKSILPVLTAKANTILSQMSAGKMRMKFVPDKVIKSNAAREIETLDVYVEEDGRSRPYLSRSGGEKVKAGLSAILALSELKNNSNGIQIGMLFIDEPPFLDESGVQAYCDGLEMISNQYSYLKVMTITHDPAMKARFPRSLDVVADENGSHVLAA